MRPEIQLSSNPIYSGKIINVKVDTVRLPSGREAKREVVEHSAAVVIVPVDVDDNVVLVRQYRYPTGQALLEAPAGGVDGDESPDAAAHRELQEEIGFAAGRLERLGQFWSVPGFCTEFMHAYAAYDLVPSSLDADEDEDIDVERYPLAEIPAMIRNGDIQDAKTIAALLMVIQGR